MLHRKDISVTLSPNQPLWTQDESIAYECAREVINDMIGICSSLINKEEKKAIPNLKRIQQLGEQAYQEIDTSIVRSEEIV